MALPNQELVLEIKQEPTWPDDATERTSNQGFQTALKEADERASRSPDSQGTENIEMVDLDNESATIEDLGEEWGEDETSNLCDPLCHMTSEALRSPDSSEGGDVVSGGSKRGTMPKGGPQASGKGKALKRNSKGLSKATPTRTSSRLSSQSSRGHGHGQDVEEAVVLSDTPQSPDKRTNADSPLLKKKRKFTRQVLTDEQEESLVDWLQTYPELFDKGNKRYKDIEYKNSLWDEKAAELGLASGEHLQVWYKSMRTRFGKLQRLKSAGERCRDYTYRDKWIMKNFEFIAPHIYACPRGTAFPLKQKLQSRPQSGSEDDDNYDDLYNLPTIPSSTALPSTSATMSSASASAASKGPVNIDPSQFVPLPDGTLYPGLSGSSAPANPLLAGLSTDILSSQNSNSMAKGYGTFLSTVAPSLHPSLLTQFYQDSWNLVMKYHMESEKLKEKERQELPVPLAVRPFHPPS